MNDLPDLDLFALPDLGDGPGATVDALDALDSTWGPADDVTDEENPVMAVPLTGDVAADISDEWKIIKAGFKAQDDRQRAQFGNLYNAGFYTCDVYPSEEECQAGMRLMAAVLGFDYERAGMGFFRDGRKVTRALHRTAAKLGIDVSNVV